MTQADAFLAAILAEPQEDAPRLIFADWLTDHGEAERAEFIRVQCELAAGRGEQAPCKNCNGAGIYTRVTNKAPRIHKGSARGESGRRVMTYRSMEPILTETEHLCVFCNATGFVVEQSALRRRERELLDPPPVAVGQISFARRYTWFLGFPEAMAFDPQWRRGFVAKVTCTGAGWLQHGDAIRAAQPVETVRLTMVPRVIATTDGKHYLYGLIPEEVISWRLTMSNRDAGPIALRLLAERFPGITFEMPTPAQPYAP